MIFVFSSLLLFIALPFCILAALVQIKPLHLLLLVGFGAGLIYLIYQIEPQLQAIAPTDDTILAAICWTLLIFAVAATMIKIKNVAKNSRQVINLDWASNITQREMEHRGARVLTRLGWRTMEKSSTVGYGLYESCKNKELIFPDKEGKEYLFPLFMKNTEYLSLALRRIASDAGYPKNRIVLITYDPITSTMRSSVEKVDISVMNYKQLNDIDNLCRRLVARENGEKAGGLDHDLYK